MLDGILSPAFLQAAGRAGKSAPDFPDKLLVHVGVKSNNNPLIFFVASEENFDITYLNNQTGVKTTESYAPTEMPTMLVVDAAESSVVEIAPAVHSFAIIAHPGGPIVDLTDFIKDIESVDVSPKASTVNLSFEGCPNLNRVTCDDNKTLESVVFANCPKIEEINCSLDTKLYEFGAGDCEELKRITLSGCSLANPTAIEIGNCENLQVIDVSGTQATVLMQSYAANPDDSEVTIDASYSDKLEEFSVDNARITSLDLRSSILLQILSLVPNSGYINELLYDADENNVREIAYGGNTIYGAIENILSLSTVGDGVLRVRDNAGDAGYDSLITAATTKGWTIEQIE